MSTGKIKPQTVARLVCLALILTLLTVTLVGEITRSREVYFFEAATRAAYAQTDDFTGYVFRDEVAPTSANNGPIRYLIGEGQAVQKGALLAEVFRDDTGTDKRERAAALYAEIASLQATLDTQQAWKNLYLGGYPELMRSLSIGAYSGAVTNAAQISGALAARECEKTQNEAALRERIAALQAELDEMVEHTNDPIPVPAAMDGIFYHSADGLEAVFGTKAAATLTPEGLTALLRATPEPVAGIGRLVSRGTWYLAVPTDRTVADTYTVSQNYALRFAQGTLSMTLDRITPAAEGDACLLLFRADAMPAWLSPSRAQSVQVERGVLTGLSVPAHALVENNAVYILEDGVARLRYVTPLQTKGGCLLVLAEQKSGKLCEGDLVIVGTRQLFDGKALK